MPLYGLPAHYQDRIHTLTDGAATTLDEAIDQWEAAQEALMDNTQLIELVKLGFSAVQTFLFECSLFATDKTRDKATKFIEDYKTLNARMKELSEPPF